MIEYYFCNEQVGFYLLEYIPFHLAKHQLSRKRKAFYRSSGKSIQHSSEAGLLVILVVGVVVVLICYMLFLILNDPASDALNSSKRV